MEVIIQLLFVIALVRYSLVAALSGNLWQLFAYGAFASMVALALYPMVINESATTFTELLGSHSVVGNIGLIVVAEAIIGIAISVYLIDRYLLSKSTRRRFTGLLKIMPSLIMLFGVAYFELLFFKWRVGGDFLVTALYFSAILFVGVTVLALAMRYLMGGEGLKLEVKLILNLSIMALGLLISSSVAEHNLSDAHTVVEWSALISIVGVSALLILMGLGLHKINFSHKIKTLLKWNR